MIFDKKIVKSITINDFFTAVGFIALILQRAKERKSGKQHALHSALL